MGYNQVRSLELCVTKDTQKVNGKSIMGIMMLGAGQYVELVLEIEWPEEQQMEQALITLIDSRFGEND